jgi:hypothetical protein
VLLLFDTELSTVDGVMLISPLPPQPARTASDVDAIKAYLRIMKPPGVGFYL